MKLPELKALMKENKIKRSSLMNKPEIIALLVEKGILSKEDVKPKPKPVRLIDPKYSHLKNIRNNPRSVEIRDLETGACNVYPSIYKASRALGGSTRIIIVNNGKVWHERYAIRIC